MRSVKHPSDSSVVASSDPPYIAVEDLQAVRQAYHARELLFQWRRNDVLLLDNILAAHGRKPFTGERRILVAMG